MDSLPSRNRVPPGGDAVQQQTPPSTRRPSSSQGSEDSQTAADFLRSQMQLEAEAREALPYSIEHCTKPLGRLRQSIFACLTCNPPPEDPAQPYDRPAGVCYACSVQCHGEHTLVEIFNKRNFTCDCGTTRFSAAGAESAGVGTPCALRLNSETETKGNVRGEPADPDNKYNHNFRNRFCGCACDYDPFEQKGTMFQCLGLGTHETGGCGEDWWHPGCVVGLGPKWYETNDQKSAAVDAEGDKPKEANTAAALPTISEDAESAPPVNGDAGLAGEAETAVETHADEEEEDLPMPPGFPKEDDFEGFICYKCVEAYPWIKRYAGAPGFLAPVLLSTPTSAPVATDVSGTASAETGSHSLKRKAEDDGGESGTSVAEEPETATQDAKRIRAEDEPKAETGTVADTETKKGEATDAAPACKLQSLPPAPAGRFSLFFSETFRDSLCRCADCFPLLKPHPQLLEEEETYEPPVSDDGGSAAGGAPSHGSGSIYDRGESALQNVDRVRAIEGVMAYNHLKDKLKPFFQQFAESGQAISAEDIKAYFAKLRGDEQAIREAGEGASRSSDNRREQSGF